MRAEVGVRHFLHLAQLYNIFATIMKNPMRTLEEVLRPRVALPPDLDISRLTEANVDMDMLRGAFEDASEWEDAIAVQDPVPPPPPATARTILCFSK